MAPSSQISTISTDQLLGLIESDECPFLLDVRDVDEVAEWQIPLVHNIPVNSLESRIDEVPCDLGLVTICAAGTRALRAAEILAAHGIASDVLQGGMNAWASTFDSVTGQFGGATVMQLRRRGKDVSLTSSAQVPTVSSSTPPS